MISTDTLIASSTQYLEINKYLVDNECWPRVRRLFLSTVPIYWRQPGLLDFKILKSERSNEFLTIANWKKEEYALKAKNADELLPYTEELIEIITEGGLTIVETLHDQYELIE